MLHKHDIVVCGGGLAGVGAAVAAARQGADVLLVERLEMLGGLGSAGCVGNFCAADGGLLGQGKVFADILEGLHARRAMGAEYGWPVKRNQPLKRVNHTFDYRVLPTVLQKLARDTGVQLLHATDVVGAELDGDRITHAVLHNRSLIQNVSANVFIDATGDGILSRHAGGKALPDDPALPGVIKPSNMLFMRHSSHAPPPLPDDAEIVCTDGTTPNYSVWPDIDGHVALKMKLFHRALDTSSGQGHSDAVVAMRNEAPAFCDHFRQHHRTDYVYAGAAPMLGLRESVRIAGDHVLAIEECRRGARFPDAVAYGTFTVDANETAEILPPYQIPLGSLTVRGVENCLVVGRCFSADRLALSSARIMATCCLMGQAAGVTAAAATSTRTTVRTVSPASVVDALVHDDPNPLIIRERLA